MHPSLRPCFQHVWPLFWPWFLWNLLCYAAWYERTGQEALLAVDCFGNIRIACLGDAPKPDDLYTYEAPRVAAWERLAPGFALPEGGFAAFGLSGLFGRLMGRLWPVSGPLAGLCSHVRGPP